MKKIEQQLLFLTDYHLFYDWINVSKKYFNDGLTICRISSEKQKLFKFTLLIDGSSWRANCLSEVPQKGLFQKHGK